MQFRSKSVDCSIEASAGLAPSTLAKAHRALLRILGLCSRPAELERLAQKDRLVARLVGRRAGLRMPLTADEFEALVWAIVGQQVHLRFAYAMRRRLVRLCGMAVGGTAVGGTAVGGQLFAHPSAAQVASLDYRDLVPLQFSRRKAEYLIDAARLVHAGDLSLDALAHEPVSKLEERLLAVRGIGIWSARYVLMRGFGLPDCVPLGDAGLRKALQRFFELEEPPTQEESERLMERFAPARSLATFHLWSLLGDPT